MYHKFRLLLPDYSAKHILKLEQDRGFSGLLRKGLSGLSFNLLHHGGQHDFLKLYEDQKRF